MQILVELISDIQIWMEQYSESTNFADANYDLHTLDTISKDAKNQLKKQGKLMVKYSK